MCEEEIEKEIAHETQILKNKVDQTVTDLVILFTENDPEAKLSKATKSKGSIEDLFEEW